MRNIGVERHDNFEKDINVNSPIRCYGHSPALCNHHDKGDMVIMHFEDFVIELDEEGTYDAWFNNEATPRQQEVARRIIREEVSEEESNIEIERSTRGNRFIDALRRALRI